MAAATPAGAGICLGMGIGTKTLSSANGWTVVWDGAVMGDGIAAMLSYEQLASGAGSFPGVTITTTANVDSVTFFLAEL
jgi:hypothetical protein